MNSLAWFFNIWLRALIVLTPFFALTMFLSLTGGFEPARRNVVARRTTLAALVAVGVLFFVGERIFGLLGITLDAFRIGAGTLLFLSALALAQGRMAVPSVKEGSDPSVVPLAIPTMVGPAAAGIFVVLAAECRLPMQKLGGFIALAAATLCVGAMLHAAIYLERKLGSEVLAVLTKLTGLLLSAMAAQMIFTGIRNLLQIAPG